jgi:hypothetical protein
MIENPLNSFQSPQKDRATVGSEPPNAIPSSFSKMSYTRRRYFSFFGQNCLGMMDNPTAFGLFSENDAISAQLHCFQGSCNPFFSWMDPYSILQPGERVLSDTGIDDSARLTLRCGLTQSFQCRHIPQIVFNFVSSIFTKVYVNTP